ncbi:hypothetical protein P5808_21800 [Bacillus cereus]|uniref:aminoacyl--tRNA ligase-related protein n=1 Tax=Bacillus cereus TaxID=1396 RepID=UPI002405E4F1|nr:aminoacyl--tRNA ligase-related protein [Bacillus cereus]MDF9506817.1 hypothetical protein [Bacillus cereus]MDF9596635.1 hypothetical protein [Bacillus cereus]MDF9609782.1 hypothetical protein [Bacillus cereus]MDF9659997.1 hypothetical protein [Bacillus cereus]
MKIQLPIPIHFKKEFLSEFIERIAYISTNIQFVQFLELEEVIEIELINDENIEDLYIAYEGLVESSKKWKMLSEKELKSNLPINEKHVNPLKSVSDVAFYEEIELELLDFFDREFIAIAKNAGANLRQYPLSLTNEVMDLCKYHTNFPQNIFAVFEIPHNYQIIDKIRQEGNVFHSSHFQNSGRFLQPCICYHCYSEWKNQQFHVPQVITAKGNCFRHEIPWRINPLRKLEFTMREIVFIGSGEQVLELRMKILEEVWNLFNDLGLNGKVVTASDPFFFYEDMDKATFQKMANAKYELVAVMNGESSSIASFNYCSDSLCKSFSIKDGNGESLHSGCVAFGIDRWLQMFLKKHGKNKAGWPKKIFEKK